MILVAVISGATAVCISYRAYRQNLEDQMTQTAENLSRAAAVQVTAEAKQATLAFADYLRMNMSMLNTRELVPFSRELDHIKTYLLLEQLRFGAELQVVMDIGTTDFMLPALTVSMVEIQFNSVVFPLPDASIMAINSPSCTSKLMRSRALVTLFLEP